MNPFMDPLAISESFFALNDAWLQEGEDFLECFGKHHQAMLRANRKVSEFSQMTATNDCDSIEKILLYWVRHQSRSNQQYHQVLCDWLTEYIAKAPGLSAGYRTRAHFWARQLTDMLAPANFFWANPKAVQRFIETRGESLNHGYGNWIADLFTNQGVVRLSDRNGFRLGDNLAATRGHVIYRNHLMELIQYAPMTDTVWPVPIVLIQPWINKYYIFDLSPQNSFVNYLVRQGFTVFITSWKNPGKDMRHIDFADYLSQGAMQAIAVARRICGCDAVHAAGYCIGGTLLATLMGWLKAEKNSSPVVDATLFASMLDFSNPGDLGALVHPGTVAAIEKMTKVDGVLKARYIDMAFRMLNPNDLIWRHVVNNYFHGKPPPRSDMLYWNSDGTNLPEAMCKSFLKWFYLENRLAQADRLMIDGRAINLGEVREPLYVVGSAKDHICPWPGTFQSCGLMGRPVRYVLADEGHITGIVNPPSPWSKKRYWAGGATRRRDPEKWLRKQQARKGSWWPDWIEWLKPRSGGRQTAPPAMGCEAYPPLAPAPGTYVFE